MANLVINTAMRMGAMQACLRDPYAFMNMVAALPLGDRDLPVQYDPARMAVPVRRPEPMAGVAMRSMGLDRALSREDARREIKASKCPEIGNGYFKTAYSVRVQNFPEPSYRAYDPIAYQDRIKTEERVLLVSRLDKASLDMWQCAMKYETDPYAPKVYGLLWWHDGFLVETERLQHRQSRDDYGNVSPTPRPEHQWLTERRKPSGMLLDRSPFMREVNMLVQRKGYHWDLHTANYMFRGEQPVITDPIHADID